MAQGKKSFQLYTEWIEVFEELDHRDAGQLIKHIFRYVNDLNPQTENQLVSLSFIQIKQQLKRDLKKWEGKCTTNRANGAKGGRPKNPKEPKITERLISKPKKPDKVEVEDKEEENIHIPVFLQFKLYAINKKPLVDLDSLKLKYDAWIENDWKNGNGKKIVNWKIALLNTLPYIKESKPNQELSSAQRLIKLREQNGN